MANLSIWRKKEQEDGFISEIVKQLKTDTPELEKLHNKQIIGLKQNILHKVGLPKGQKKIRKLFLSTVRIC